MLKILIIAADKPLFTVDADNRAGFKNLHSVLGPQDHRDIQAQTYDGCVGIKPFLLHDKPGSFFNKRKHLIIRLIDDNNVPLFKMLIQVLTFTADT